MTQASGPEDLSSAEASSRLWRNGSNELIASSPSSVLTALASFVREPLFILLFAAAGLYAWLGERADALALMAPAAVSAAIHVVQRYRTERALIALRQLASTRTLVLRDGRPQRIPSRELELVLGDCVLLSEGDRVPANAQLAEAHNLTVDESLLTGGSSVLAQTLVVAGQARAVITAVSGNTEVGRICAARNG